MKVDFTASTTMVNSLRKKGT
ncbi:hypothetical protein Gorai_007011 [Gossypium raimondii]|uniref:Uncharacterized protein n=1 Tax=Gossypium raimondii TaxID=29730 RepID=A0A7J8Q7D6_GOSRA|nr:hypothetical protein [Gossypium raimondii]